MKLSIGLSTALTQTLTPQQIQYLKLLQLPALQLEQYIRQEIEQNPMLEAEDDFGAVAGDAEPVVAEMPAAVMTPPSSDYEEHGDDYGGSETENYNTESERDPFEHYDMAWEDSSESGKGKNNYDDDGDDEGYQIRAVTTFIEDLTEQFMLLPLSEEDKILGEHILGNIDSDGYLRRDMAEIVEDANIDIAERNQRMLEAARIRPDENGVSRNGGSANPAREFALRDSIGSIMLPENTKFDGFEEFDEDEIIFPAQKQNSNGHAPVLLGQVNLEQAEILVKKIQRLDPPGIGARTIQECLLAQLYSVPRPNAGQKLAVEVLEKSYQSFAMKHYTEIAKQLDVEIDYLREALEVIRRLNPKPGGGSASHEHNTVIPDFLVEREEESGDIFVSLNDSRIPPLRVSEAYERLRKSARKKQFNKDTREWLRKKHDDAKFLIQAIRQRKMTMLKVMTAIAELQRNFFELGESGHKPLIYKDVSEATGLDISTISRIVNGKYVQTEFGTFELRYFFSESLANDEGEEVSTRIIKQKIKEMIDKEAKGKPLSDDKISKDLKKFGYNVARRTVAKYREQLRIPVARLRKEL